MMSIENPAKKTQYIRYENLLGAVIRPGRGSIVNQKTCGDSILIDFQNNFFAVADSPERNPFASKNFLRKLHSALSPLLESRKDNERAEEAFADVVEEIVKNTNVIIKSTGYNESTTFTGLIIDCLSGVRKALLLHNGDSLLYHYRVEKMIGEKITATNHCFVGRVDALYQVMLFDFYTDSRFLLVTDGIHDLLRNIEGNGNGKIEKMCFEVVTKNSIDMVPEMIMSSYDMNPEISDDLGLIAINPTCLSAGIKSSIII